MLLLGEQSTIDKLKKLADSLIDDAKHHEEIAIKARDKAEEIYGLVEINITLNNSWKTLLWAEQKITSMEFTEKIVEECKKDATH